MSFLEQTTYDIALRALAQQEQSLADLRARTGTLLTAASLVASFLGTQVIARSGFGDLVVLALLAFGISVVLSIYVLLPKDGLTFALDARDTYWRLHGVREDDSEVQRRLVHWIQTFRERNYPTVRHLNRVFQAAATSLLLEIGFLATGFALG